MNKRSGITEFEKAILSRGGIKGVRVTLAGIACVASVPVRSERNSGRAY